MTIRAADLQPAGMEPGIYFGLPEEKYFMDPAISRSDIRNLIMQPHKYWLSSPFNPKRKPFKETPSLKKGKMFHKLLLEEDKFFDEYYIMPGTPWENTKHKQLVKLPEYEEMIASLSVIRSIPRLDQLFRYGYAEVTIFWRDAVSGLMMKCRMDYLKHYGNVDYKTTGKEISLSSIGQSVVNYGYDIQNALYIEGTRTAREQIVSGEMAVFGDVSDAFLNDFLTYPYQDQGEEFIFVFQETDYPHAVRAIQLDQEIISAGESKIAMGIANYQTAIERWGSDLWMDTQDCTFDFLTAQHVPFRMWRDA